MDSEGTENSLETSHMAYHLKIFVLITFIHTNLT